MSLYRLEYSTDEGETWKDSNLRPCTREELRGAELFWAAGFNYGSGEPFTLVRIVPHETDAEKLARYQRSLEDIARGNCARPADYAFQTLKGEQSNAFWSEFVEKVTERRNLISGLLKSGRLEKNENGTVSISFSSADKFARELLGSHIKFLNEIASEINGACTFVVLNGE